MNEVYLMNANIDWSKRSNKKLMLRYFIETWVFGLYDITDYMGKPLSYYNYNALWNVTQEERKNLELEPLLPEEFI